MVIQEATTIAEFLAEIKRVAESNGADGMGVMVKFGDHYRTYQFKLETEDLKITSRLFKRYVDHVMIEH